MQGPFNHERGLIPRCFEYIFSQTGAEYSFRVSFCEIYNESIFDLLNEGESLQVREDRSGVYVSGLSEFHVQSEEEAYHLLKLGSYRRHTESTLMNERSSRSHSIFTLLIEARCKEEVRVSKFNLVDLAGSERQSQTKAQGMRLKEAQNINKSLLSLGKVINALADNQNYVNYRDSKLTFLLRESLGGNSKTCLIACINPESAPESLSTLRFAQRTKMIKQKVKMNITYEADVQGLMAEVDRLKHQLVQYESGVDQCLVKRVLEKLSMDKKLEEQIVLLNKQIQLLSNQVQSDKLVIKFKQTAIDQLKSQDVAAVVQSETGILKQEIARLKQELSDNSSYFQAENLRLRVKMEHYDSLRFSKLEEYEFALIQMINDLQENVVRDVSYVASDPALVEKNELLIGKVSHLESELDRLRLECDDLHQERDDNIVLRQYIEDLKEERVEFEDRYKELNYQLEQTQEALALAHDRVSYLEKENEESTNCVSSLRTECTKLADEIKTINEDLAKSSADKCALEQRQNKLQENIEDLNEKLGKSNAQISELKLETCDLQAKLKSAEQVKSDLIDKIRQTEQIVLTVTSEKAELSALLAQKTKELNSSIQELEQAHLNNSALQDRLSKLEQEFDVFHQSAQVRENQLEEALQASVAQLDSVKQSLNLQTQTISELRVEYTSVESEFKQCRSKQDALFNEKQELEIQHNSLLIKYNQLESSIENTAATTEELRAEFEVVVSENTELMKQLQSAQLDLQQKQSQLDIISSAIDNVNLIETENKTLETKLGMILNRNKQLEEENANLLRHNNYKQKLQYHLQIKNENNQLRMENQRLQMELSKLR